MEIERKFLIEHLPFDPEQFPHKEIRQAYLCADPVVRVRRAGEKCILTIKSSGLMEREEYEMLISEEAFSHLLSKADGRIIEKTRYKIPLEGSSLVIELDIFSGDYRGLMTAEVEFPDRETALSFVPPTWFGEDVTMSGKYQNNVLALVKK